MMCLVDESDEEINIIGIICMHTNFVTDFQMDEKYFVVVFETPRLNI